MFKKYDTWGEFLFNLVQHPIDTIQANWYWLIVILIVLFSLSRLNNFLEIKGTDRAIRLGRGITSTITLFIIAPLIFILLLNLFALIYGLPSISLLNLWKWFELTLTSLWWIVSSFVLYTQGIPSDSESVFSADSIVRLAAIILPGIFVWLRAAKSSVTKFLLIPLVIGVLWVTKNRAAPSTFLSETIEQWKSGEKEIIPGVDIKVPDFNSIRNTQVATTRGSLIENIRKSIDPKTRNLIMLGSLAALLVAMFGFSQTKKFRALFLSLIFLAAIFFIAMLMAADRTVKDVAIEDRAPPTETRTPQVTDENNDFLYSLMSDFEDEFNKQNGEKNLKLYDLSLQISERFLQIDMQPPPRYCTRYRDYFDRVCDTYNK